MDREPIARSYSKLPIGLRAPTTWYTPHEIPGVFHKLLRHGRGFGLSDLEETAKVAGHRPPRKKLGNCQSSGPQAP